MKGKRRWTRWYTDRLGFGGEDWAQRWTDELRQCELPGPDYILRAANGPMDLWLDRPADYADTRRALHLVLMLACPMSATEAVEYNPHGFRHLLVSVGQQLRSFGVVSESDLERLGHWSKGSPMPGKYDSAAGVSELGRGRRYFILSVQVGVRLRTANSLWLIASPRYQPLIGVGLLVRPRRSLTGWRGSPLQSWIAVWGMLCPPRSLTLAGLRRRPRRSLAVGRVLARWSLTARVRLPWYPRVPSWAWNPPWFGSLISGPCGFTRGEWTPT